MSQSTNFPSRATLIESTYKSLVACNGSATNDEILDTVIDLLKLSDEVINIMHTDNMQTKLQYELRWARTYLKKYGAIQNSKKGVWTISNGYDENSIIKGSSVCQKVRELDAKPKKSNEAHEETPVEFESYVTESSEENLRNELSQILRNMNCYDFEKLVMRLLRECGFSKVSVTKKSGDDGIDGFGKVILNGIVSINVAFQCKRYSGVISNSQIRDFRGSLSAGIEKGIFITTGAYSNPAIQDAMDPGKTPSIDLIDGEQLIDLLLEHELGVIKETKTVYSIDKSFFSEV